MAVAIYEAGRHIFVVGINFKRCGDTFQIADIVNFIADDCDICKIRGLSSTIDNGAVTDDNIRFSLISEHMKTSSIKRKQRFLTQDESPIQSTIKQS